MENDDEYLTADSGKINKYDDNTKISSEEDQETDKKKKIESGCQKNCKKNHRDQ